MGEIKGGETIGPVACRLCDLFQVCRAIDAIPAAFGLPPCPTLRVVEAGEVLYSAGNPTHYVYALRKGLVKSERIDATGTRVVALHVLGEVIGEEGIRGGRYASTVTAVTSAMFCELPFREIAKWDSEAVQTALAALADMPSSRLTCRPRRAQDRLNNFAKDLVGRLQSHGIAAREIAIDMPRYELAEMVDVGIDSLRRALGHAENGSQVQLRGNQIIVRA